MVFVMIGCFAFVGLVGAAIGDNRGRRTAGFWLGVLLGPVGWLAVLLGPDRRAFCPHCRSPLLAADASVCARCGRDVSDPSLAAPSAPRHSSLIRG